jgi:anthranilate/para-aminobenzoate synthase component I
VPLHVVGLTYEAGVFASSNRDGLEQLPLPEGPAVIVATYQGYLLGPSERGPWECVGDCAELLAALEGPPIAVSKPNVRLRDGAPREAHELAVLGLKEGIARGDFYQVNLARRLEGDCPEASGPAIYAALRAIQSTAFGALWALSDGWLVSGSPECLFRWDGRTRRVSTFPIKGTRPRGKDVEEDRALSAALRDSDKDRAEHVMIVDLARNDLGRVAETGTVEVPALYAELPLETVRHMVSEVTATVRPEHDLASLIGTLFPGGSITGAPRIAAMKAIATHEPFARGFYCGSLGVVMGEDEAVFSILIRTATLSRGRLVYCTGGGIVADSDPADEWRETEVKARALERALSDQPPSPTRR